MLVSGSVFHLASLALQNFEFETPSFIPKVHRKTHVSDEQKPWLVVGYRGWDTTQLYRDYNEPL